MLLACVAAGPTPNYRAHTAECVKCSFLVTSRVECSAAFNFADEAVALARARALAAEMGTLEFPFGSLIVSAEDGTVLAEIPIIKPPSKLN